VVVELSPDRARSQHGLLRLYHQYALIRFLVTYWNLPSPVEPWEAMVAMVIYMLGGWFVFWMPATGSPLKALFLALLAGALGWVVARGQLALNAHWEATAVARRSRVQPR